MNIFVTDRSPEQCAINLDDKRVRHMPKETIEMLSCAIYDREGYFPVKVPYWQKSFDPEHTRTLEGIRSHPVTKWVSTTPEHIVWTLNHLFYLIDECHYRGFTQQYEEYNPLFNLLYRKLKYYIMNIEINYDNIKFRNSSLYKNVDVIQGYRDTMMNKWFVTDIDKDIKWTNRKPPNWCSTQQKLF